MKPADIGELTGDQLELKRIVIDHQHGADLASPLGILRATVFPLSH
jgi:hypothetical protein